MIMNKQEERMKQKMKQINKTAWNVMNMVRGKSGYKELEISINHSWEGTIYKIGYKVDLIYQDYTETILFSGVDVYDGEEKCFFQKELLFYIYEMYQRIILHTNAFEKDGYYSCNFEDCSKYFQTVSANIDATLEFIENTYGEKIPLDTSFIKNFIPKAS